MNIEPQNKYEQILAQAVQQKRIFMELQGLFKGTWEGVDAQDYVNQERGSWAVTV
jgi:hypothetical protein